MYVVCTNSKLIDKKNSCRQIAKLSQRHIIFSSHPYSKNDEKN